MRQCVLVVRGQSVVHSAGHKSGDDVCNVKLQCVAAAWTKLDELNNIICFKLLILIVEFKYCKRQLVKCSRRETAAASWQWQASPLPVAAEFKLFIWLLTDESGKSAAGLTDSRMTVRVHWQWSLQHSWWKHTHTNRKLTCSMVQRWDWQWWVTVTSDSATKIARLFIHATLFSKTVANLLLLLQRQWCWDQTCRKRLSVGMGWPALGSMPHSSSGRPSWPGHGACSRVLSRIHPWMPASDSNS